MMLLHLMIILMYLVSSAGYLVFLFAQKEWLNKAAYGSLAAGFALHTGRIAAAWIHLGYVPVQNLHHTLSFAAWTLAGAYLLLKYRYHLKILGLFAAPLTALIMIIASFVPDVAPAEPSSLFKSIWLVAHVIMIFLGDAALALACGTGILYLLQEHAIKTKSNRFFLRRLPSLQFLDFTGYSFVITGFTLLTIGLITGMVYAQAVWGHFWSWDPKEIWSGVTWLIYAALLHERLVAGWRGRRAAIMSIIGFAAVLFTFFGVNFFLEGHHDVFTRW